MTSQRPSHRYLLGSRKSIYVPETYQMLPPQWDGFVPIVESLAEPAWEGTTLLDDQSVKLDIIERAESGINLIVVVLSTHLSINLLS